MKKSLLSVLILSAGIAVQAQNNIHEGYHPNGDPFQPKPYAADFVSIPASFDNVYWWNQFKKGTEIDSAVFVKSDSLSGIIATPKPCTHRELPFVYKSTRDDVNQVLKYNFDLPYGVYAPIGVGFGEGNSLDLSQDNAFIAFTFKNTSTTTIDITVGLQDLNKNIVNSLPKTRKVAPGQIYTEEVKFTSIIAGEERNIKVNYNPKDYPAAPYYAKYPKDTCDRGLTPSKDSTFNFAITEAVTFTIVNHSILPGKNGEYDGFKPLPFKGTFEISKFRVGTYDSLLVTGLNDEDYISANKFNVYPNPVVAGGTINLSSEATNIKVMNVLGNIVLSSASAKQINVAMLNKGVYTITSSKGRSRFVVE